MLGNPFVGRGQTPDGNKGELYAVILSAQLLTVAGGRAIDQAVIDGERVLPDPFLRSARRAVHELEGLPGRLALAVEGLSVGSAKCLLGAGQLRLQREQRGDQQRSDSGRPHAPPPAETESLERAPSVDESAVIFQRG
ncbi:MAG: hypothetical protein E6I52_18640 [Chloroflexi bacterium]|nr:MAG: hypothetical protein E6I52_18640 [Chloroflexota bacterium]